MVVACEVGGRWSGEALTFLQLLADAKVRDEPEDFRDDMVAEHSMDGPCANPIVQTMQKTVEVPQMQYIGKIDDVSVVVQCQIPTVQAVQKAVEVPQFRFRHRVDDVPVVMQRQTPQERIQERLAEKTDVLVLKSQLPEGGSTLLAGNKLSSKLDGNCAARAPEWKERATRTRRRRIGHHS